MSEQPSEEAVRPKRGRVRWTTIGCVLAIGLALLGWWLSLDMLFVSYGLHATSPIVARVCRADDTGPSPCDRVVHSPYGSLALSKNPAGPRLPTAVLGMGYFAYVACWFGLYGAGDRRRGGWYLLVLVPVLGGAWESWRLIAVMRDVLGQWCPGCLSVHAVNGLILLLTLALAPWWRRAGAGPAVPHRLGLAAGLAGGLLFLLHPVVMLWLQTNRTLVEVTQAYQKITENPEFIVWSWQQSERFEQLNAADPRTVGPAEATHTIVVFSDFACPACRQLHGLLEQLLRDAALGQRFRLVVRHFPLDRTCNPGAKRTLHPGACSAALAAQAAFKLGGIEAYERFGALLFEHREAIAAQRYDALARQAGLDPAALAEAMNDPEVRRQVARDIEVAQEAGLTVTPGVFLDGRRVGFWRSLEGWKALLEQ